MKKLTFKFRMLLIPLLVCLGISASAQRTVTGAVISADDNLGIPGASIIVKGSNPLIGTVTDINGRFSISVPADLTTLVFSFTGMATQEIDVAGQTSVNVVMRSTAIGLDAVVVIGYGTATRERLTGAVSTVGSADFRQGAFSNPAALIAGKVPGVNITPEGGRPGAANRIRIRGGASLNASNDPLIVIDGLPVSNSQIAGQSNPLTSLNPNDIESMTILKDAAATAIYGSRASNGVILITTKKGAKGSGQKLSVDVSSMNSVSTIARRIDLLNANEYRELINSYSYINDQHRNRFVSLLGDANTDWQDEIFRTAFATDNNVAVSGVAAKRVPYRVSIGNLHQNGILRTDHINRTTASVSVQPTFLDNHLKFDVNVRGSIQESRFGDAGAIGAAIRMDPTKPVTAPGMDVFNGYWQWDDGAGARNEMATSNPVSLLESRNDLGRADRIFGNVQMEYKMHFMPELRANVNLGFDTRNGSGENIYSPWSPRHGHFGQGRYNKYDITQTDLLFEAYLAYTKNMGKHHVDAVAGHTFQEWTREELSFPTYFYDRTTVVPGTNPVFPRYLDESALLSFFGRVNYSFNNRYLFTASLRTDGSSRFAKENRWGTFPSLSAAWRIDREDFLVNNPIVSNLKLRLGWGVTGQQEIRREERYDHLARYTQSEDGEQIQFGDNWYHFWAPTAYDPDRRWESTTTWNAGLDFAFLTEKIYGSVDVYFKQTKDLFNSVPMSMGANFINRMTRNIGSMENKGLEFAINYVPIDTRDLTIDVGFNLTLSRAKITKLTAADDDEDYVGVRTGGISGGTGNNILIHSVGHAPSSFWVFQQIYDVNGRPAELAFVDRNRDGIINDLDFYRYQSIAPRAFLGFNLNATWKNLTLSTMLRSNIGNYVYNNVDADISKFSNILNPNNYLQNTTRDIYNTGFQGGSPNLLFTDYFVQNASFLKMDYLSLSYNFGKVFRGINVSSSFTIQNVFTMTKYTGIDPEIYNGIDNNLYPFSRTFSLGLRFTY
jgi:iron complex outermembrane receptor protein